MARASQISDNYSPSAKFPRALTGGISARHKHSDKSDSFSRSPKGRIRPILDNSEAFGARFEARAGLTRGLFPGHITEIRAIRCGFRELVGRTVANGFLYSIGRFFPIGIVEHICQSLW